MSDTIGFIRATIINVLKFFDLYSLYCLRRGGALKDAGWFKSFKTKTPIDRDGKPIPWMTYSAISFLERRINSNLTVFEYGCGNSTFWWARRVKNIVSCEHDMSWHEKIKELIPVNAELYHINLEYNGKYSKFISKYNQVFDIIVIDGRDRVNCAKNSLSALKENGVIIWDNSDRDCYEEGYIYLLNSGYKKIDFEGMGPVHEFSWCTSIFYKGENCLNI